MALLWFLPARVLHGPGCLSSLVGGHWWGHHHVTRVRAHAKKDMQCHTDTPLTHSHTHAYVKSPIQSKGGCRNGRTPQSIDADRGSRHNWRGIHFGLSNNSLNPKP